AAYVPYFTRARPDSQDHAPRLAPGPAAATIRSATTASAITAPRAMKSGDRGMGPDYPSVDAKARLSLGLENRQALAHEPDALSRGEPDVVGLVFLGDPEMARLAGNLQAPRSPQLDELAGGERHAGSPHRRTCTTVACRDAKSRVSVVIAARIDA